MIIVSRILCLLGFHAWEYGTLAEAKILRICKHCHKEEWWTEKEIKW